MQDNKVTNLSIETIDRFRNWSIGRGQSMQTTKAYSTDLRMFLKAVGESSIFLGEMEELSQSWLNLTREASAPSTTNRRLASLRAFSKWAGMPRLLPDYIAPKVGKGIPHRLPDGLADLEKLLAVSKNHSQQALIGLMGYCGLRVNEALDAKCDWFDLDNMEITVRGKGDKTRTIPVSPRAWSAICMAYAKAFTEGREYIVEYQDRGARKTIESMGKRAKIKRHISSHDLRMTFATIIYDEHLNIRLVQELLGHTSSATTEIYTQVNSREMKKAVDF